MSIELPKTPLEMYEVAFLIRNEWNAHSLSNIGSGGTNRLLRRRQQLANGVETDACSGDILKHHNAALLAQYFEAEGLPLCPACSSRDSRRAGALADTRNSDVEMSAILQCPQCDMHGFFLPARKATVSTPALPARNKDSLVEFSYALAEPQSFGETVQLNARTGGADGEDQMIMRSSCRSGAYAMCIRYKSAGVGVDTRTWDLVVNDVSSRRKRHQCVLNAIRDQVLSPDGAKAAGMLPHLTGISGAIVVRFKVGRAFMCSPLRLDFVQQLVGAVSRNPDASKLFLFKNLEEFAAHMEFLIAHTVPAVPCKNPLPLLGV